MSSDFCVRCDNALSVYCGNCMDGVRDERDALHRALRETLAALGNGSAATSEASVAFMANTPNEVRAVVDDLRRERDDYKAKLDAELPAAWREDVESLDRLNERLCGERDEARAELSFIQAEYAAANESDLTRDALCLQLAALKHELRMATERAAIAGRERDEAVALNQAMNRLRARGSAKRCACQWEEGDSPCPVHGEEER